MSVRAKYLVTVAMLAALVVGAFAPAGACLRTAFGAGHVAARQVAAANMGKTPSRSQIPACCSDTRIMTANVSERSVVVHHVAPALCEIQAFPTVSAVTGVPDWHSGNSSAPPFLSSSVLRI